MPVKAEITCQGQLFLAMMNDIHKNTFLIVYFSGAYGTFLDWCINWFSGQIEENVLPFTDNGSAHRWRGNPAGDVIAQPDLTIERMLESEYDQVPLTMRTHLTFTDYIRTDHENLIKSYQSKFKKVLLINNDVDCHLLLLHNMMTKSRASSYEKTIEEIVSKYKNIFDAQEPIPAWQLREMTSYWHNLWHCKLRDTWQPIHDSNIVNIELKNLVYNFEQCLCDLFKELELPMVRKDRLAEIKNTWLSLQKFKDYDRHFNDIVTNTVNNVAMPIECNTLFDEAFIQWKLRDQHNLDLMCYGLNIFPKNTQDLKSLLVPYQNKG